MVYDIAEDIGLFIRIIASATGICIFLQFLTVFRSIFLWGRWICRQCLNCCTWCSSDDDGNIIDADDLDNYELVCPCYSSD